MPSTSVSRAASASSHLGTAYLSPGALSSRPGHCCLWGAVPQTGTARGGVGQKGIEVTPLFYRPGSFCGPGFRKLCKCGCPTRRRITTLVQRHYASRQGGFRISVQFLSLPESFNGRLPRFLETLVVRTPTWKPLWGARKLTHVARRALKAGQFWGMTLRCCNLQEQGVPAHHFLPDKRTCQQRYSHYRHAGHLFPQQQQKREAHQQGIQGNAPVGQWPWQGQQPVGQRVV